MFVVYMEFCNFYRLNDNAGLVTNFEVYQVMREQETAKRKSTIKNKELTNADKNLTEELKTFDTQVTNL